MQKPITTGPLGRPLGVLVKPASSDCNLQCEFTASTTAASVTPTPARRAAASCPTTCSTASWRGFSPWPGRSRTFGWQGGEPTLAGLPFFERVVKRQQELKDPRQTIANALQSNVYVIDEDWAKFLREHRFLVGASIDGPEELHDRYRVTRNGKGSFATHHAEPGGHA